PEKTQRLLEDLKSHDLCTRLEATRKLGCKLHADICKEPCVVDGLLQALFSDCVWEVRAAAAEGIWKQRVRTEVGILALYLSARLDGNAQVRWAAQESLRLMMIAYRGS